MSVKTEQKLFINELCTRWDKDMDQVLDLAIAGDLTLWIEFAEVNLHPRDKNKAETGAVLPPGTFYRTTMVQPLPEELSRMQGRNDRMIIALELRCRDAQGQEVTLTNSVGEEWGDASMIAVKPATLFARPDEVARFEQQLPATDDLAALKNADAPTMEISEDRAINPRTHPCHSEELAIALHCWQTLFADVSTTGTVMRKIELIRWVTTQYSHISKTAAERIATVVLPSKTTNTPHLR